MTYSGDIDGIYNQLNMNGDFGRWALIPSKYALLV